jgi:hypothetical protein
MSAQSAADAAALAAAYQALKQVGETTPFTSSNSTVQSTVAPCDLSGNLHVGCQYSQKDGFSHGGSGGRQDVTMISNVNSAPPTVPNVTADYWVTVRTVQTIPQLFSAMLGNVNGIASARATAAIIPVTVNGSVITLNRSNDPVPDVKKASQGVNIQMGGGDQIVAPQGVVIASNISNAGTGNGNPSICGDSTCSTPVRVSVLTPGTASSICSSPCTATDSSDGPKFMDPMAGLGQPPLPSSALPTFAIQNGLFSNGVFQLNTGTNTLGNPVSLTALP